MAGFLLVVVRFLKNGGYILPAGLELFLVDQEMLLKLTKQSANNLPANYHGYCSKAQAHNYFLPLEVMLGMKCLADHFMIIDGVSFDGFNVLIEVWLIQHFFRNFKRY